jgi:hypothetical protein
MNTRPSSRRRTDRIIASVSHDLARRARDLAQSKEISLSRVIERSLLFYLQGEEGEETLEKRTPAR